MPINKSLHFRRTYRQLACRAGLLLTGLLLMMSIQAEVLDAPADNEDELAVLLVALSADLDIAGIDILHNLNDRSLARKRPDRPRLGRLADLQLGDLPSSEELLMLESSYRAGELVGLALLDDGVSTDELYASWLRAPEHRRLFITFASDDADSARAVAAAARASGMRVREFLDGAAAGGDEPRAATLIGRFYATTGQRLSLDSSAARDFDGELPDLAWLGERVRRNSDSIFRNPDNRDDRSLARSEPAVFEKESLGDEFSESTIREIIVPGGVALGETAALDLAVSSMEFDSGRLLLVSDSGEKWQVPEIELPLLKALFDFAERSRALGSDAIVDIDADSRVRISAALRDTEVGYHLMHADTVPFTYVDYLPVTKSVVIDNHIAWFPRRGAEDQLSYATEFEVRFLSADNLRLAQTRAALAFDYEHDSEEVQFERSWGRDANRLRENLDYSGLGKDVMVIAQYAGWIGLFRRLAEDDVRFLDGRYEFMKLNKTGRPTPIRYQP